MSAAESKWQSHFHFVWSHPSESSILMVSRDAGWSLPMVCVDGRIWSGDFGRINEVVQRELGSQVTALRYVSYTVEESEHRVSAIFVLENHSSTVEPTEGEWVTRENWMGLSLVLPEQRSVIEAHLAEIEHGSCPELRPPWARPGWLGAVQVWIEEQLSELGYTLVRPVEYVKSWGISCVLRAHTNADDIYFKQASTLPLFADEPSVTLALARLFPDQVPRPLGIDRERGWMLLSDFGRPVDELGKDVDRGNVYRVFAELQIRSAEHVDELLALGCLDRRLDRLSAQIDPLLGDAEKLSGLNVEEIHQLRSLAPHLKELCTRLASYSVPDTLVHGDLHMGNVALNEGEYVFFDWTDSCISHPFLDMFDIFDQREEDARNHLRDAYLASWTGYESRARLMEALALAEPLCALHQAVSYQHIIASLEPISRREMSGALPYYLRKLLRSAEELTGPRFA